MQLNYTIITNNIATAVRVENRKAHRPAGVKQKYMSESCAVGYRCWRITIIDVHALAFNLTHSLILTLSISHSPSTQGAWACESVWVWPPLARPPAQSNTNIQKTCVKQRIIERQVTVNKRRYHWIASYVYRPEYTRRRCRGSAREEAPSAVSERVSNMSEDLSVE